MGSLLLIGATAAVAVLILWFGGKQRATAFPLAFVFVLFAAITIPSILPPRIVQAQNACLANLKFIQGAKATWAERYHKLPGDVPRLEEIFSTNNVPPYHWIPKCPSGGEYNVGAVNQNPSCTLSNEGHALR